MRKQPLPSDDEISSSETLELWLFNELNTRVPAFSEDGFPRAVLRERWRLKMRLVEYAHAILASPELQQALSEACAIDRLAAEWFSRRFAEDVDCEGERFYMIDREGRDTLPLRCFVGPVLPPLEAVLEQSCTPGDGQRWTSGRMDFEKRQEPWCVEMEMQLNEIEREAALFGYSDIERCARRGVILRHYILAGVYPNCYGTQRESVRDIRHGVAALEASMLVRLSGAPEHVACVPRSLKNVRKPWSRLLPVRPFEHRLEQACCVLVARAEIEKTFAACLRTIPRKLHRRPPLAALARSRAVLSLVPR